MTPYGAAIQVEKGRMNGIQVSSSPSLGADDYNMAEVMINSMRMTLGITDYQQGQVAGSATATEAQIISNASNIRIMEARDVIYEFVINLIRKLSALIQTHSDESEYINISDMDVDDDLSEFFKEYYGFNPNIPFLRMSKEDIQGEFNFKFKIEEMVYRPKEVQVKQLLETIGAVSANPEFALPFFDDYDTSKIIKDVFDMQNIQIDKYKKGSNNVIPAVVENMMFRADMEVPAPSHKDNDDEHIMINGQIRTELKAEVDKQMQKFKSTLSGFVPESEEDVQLLEQAMNEMMDEMQPLKDKLRKVDLHIQAHEESRQKKEARKFSKKPQMPPQISGMGGMGGTPGGGLNLAPAQECHLCL